MINDKCEENLPSLRPPSRNLPDKYIVGCGFQTRPPKVVGATLVVASLELSRLLSCGVGMGKILL